MPRSKKFVAPPFDIEEALHTIQEASISAKVIVANAAADAAKKVMTEAADGPKAQLAAAARDAVTSIAIAAKDAAQTLAAAARDADATLTARAGQGDDWNDNRKLVLSELQRLNSGLVTGFDKMYGAFKSHSEEDIHSFAAVTSGHMALVTEVAALTVKVGSQLWTVWGAALGSVLAIAIAALFHFWK